MSNDLSFTQELRQMGFITKSNTEIENKTMNTENNTPSTEVKNNKMTFKDSIIYIGKKPTMNYVLAINSRMTEGLDKVTIKSRGKNINKAVDVAEIVTNRFIPEANDDEVTLSTEEVFREDGTSTNISTIEIIIQK